MNKQNNSWSRQGPLARFGRALRRGEKRIIVAWIRFARAHRDSDKLPLFLFILLFFDAFVMVIPSMVLTAAAVTITPRRWWLFALTFVLATVCNNYVTYWMGRLVPDQQILNFVATVGIEDLWFAAETAIREYGKFANLPGGLIGLPTQLVTMIIGIADSQAMYMNAGIKASIGPAIFYGVIGHGIKIFVVCGLVRYGWVKLERKYDTQGSGFLEKKSKS